MNSHKLEYTRQEMMAIATGRELRDGELAIFGVGLSMLAGYFAQEHHAPNIRAMTEGGVYGAIPVGGLPAVELPAGPVTAGWLGVVKLSLGLKVAKPLFELVPRDSSPLLVSSSRCI